MTNKRQKFIQAYIGEANGNGTKAAIMAGFKEAGAATTAYQLLRIPEIQNKIIELRERADTLAIATRADRQKFWSATMSESAAAMRDRLKASELLGRSEKDFDDAPRVNVQVPVQVVFAVAQAPGSENKT